MTTFQHSFRLRFGPAAAKLSTVKYYVDASTVVGVCDYPRCHKETVKSDESPHDLCTYI